MTVEMNIEEEPGEDIFGGEGLLEIIPLVSAVHANAIYSVTATRNGKWLFTGSEDGFIRKYDLFNSLNGSTALTGIQKHGLPDSVQRGGHILSAWENDDGTVVTGSSMPNPADNASSASLASSSVLDLSSAAAPSGNPSFDTNSALNKASPVYSLDCHSEGVWAVGGTEGGNVNLWTVRHDEGKVHHVFRNLHKGPVSVLKVTHDERHIFSGSWDKCLHMSSLDTGAIVSSYTDSTSHITSLAPAPLSDSLYLASSYDGTVYVYDVRIKSGMVVKVSASTCNSPPWTLSSCWGSKGDKIYVARRNSAVDELDLKMNSSSYVRTLRLPYGSGSVYSVQAIPNNRHLVIASYDNIRLWDLEHQATDPLSPAPKKEEGGGGGLFGDDDPFMDLFGAPQNNNNTFSKPEKKVDDAALLDMEFMVPTVPFSIIPDHGGVVSSLLITGNKLVSTGGNKGYEGASNNLCLIYDIVKTPVPSTVVS